VAAARSISQHPLFGSFCTTSLDDFAQSVWFFDPTAAQEKPPRRQGRQENRK
jgi:hypothetical protein